MNFIFIFISSSNTNLLRKKSVKQKIKKRLPKGSLCHCTQNIFLSIYQIYFSNYVNYRYCIFHDGEIWTCAVALKKSFQELIIIEICIILVLLVIEYDHEFLSAVCDYIFNHIFRATPY